MEGDHYHDSEGLADSCVSNPLRLEGDRPVPGCRTESLRVSNPLRLEGDVTRQAMHKLVKQVSNPLRLEGDRNVAGVNATSLKGFLIHYGWRGTACEMCIPCWEAKFLIHYGWRGTPVLGALVFCSEKFLIHYGWRGTCSARCSIRCGDFVSNPLRLEGDWSAMPLPLPPLASF